MMISVTNPIPTNSHLPLSACSMSLTIAGAISRIPSCWRWNPSAHARGQLRSKSPSTLPMLPVTGGGSVSPVERHQLWVGGVQITELVAVLIDGLQRRGLHGLADWEIP